MAGGRPGTEEPKPGDTFLEGLYLGRAETEAEREAVFHFRYQIYVQEMGRYRSVADHQQERFAEPEDDHSLLFYASVDGPGSEVVATSRVTCGGDGLSPRQIEQYQLEPFLERMPAEVMAVGERAMVRPDLRGGSLFLDLMGRSFAAINRRRIQLMFGASEAHLLSLYQGLGMRTYSQRNINSAEAGYLIPQLLVVEDVEYLRRLKSPFAGFAEDFGADRRVPEGLAELLEGGSAVMSRRLASGEEYWEEVHEALEGAEGIRPSALEGLEQDEAERALEKSNIIECDPGDVVVKRGGVSRNLYVVLEGTLEVRDGERVVAVLSTGDVFGEMSFLLGRPRSMDVVAAVPDTRVLSLSESAIRSLIEEDPRSASVVLLNVSKMLCLRLLKMT